MLGPVLGFVNCVLNTSDDKIIVGCDMKDEVQNHATFVMMVEVDEAPGASYLAADTHTLRMEA